MSCPYPIHSFGPVDTARRACVAVNTEGSALGCRRSGRRLSLVNPLCLLSQYDIPETQNFFHPMLFLPRMHSSLVKGYKPQER